MASTLTLLSVANFCSIHADLLPLSGVGGYTSEPFLSIASDAMAEIINDEEDWKFNSVEMFDAISTFQPLITSLSKQDYLFAGASAFVLATSSGGAAVTSSGAAIDLTTNNGVTVAAGVVTVKTLEPHRFAIGNVVNLLGLTFTTGTAANYNSSYSDNGSVASWSTGYTITVVTAKSFSFAAGTGQNNNDVGGAPGIANFGWLSGCTMMELNNNSSPPNWRQIKAVRNLPKWSRVSDPEQVAMVQDYGTGVLRFRFNQIPGGVIWAFNFIYQQSAPLFTSLGSSVTWAPIPDTYSDLIRQAVIYRMYRYLNPNSQATKDEYEKFKQTLAKSKGRDCAEESNVYLQPTQGLVDDYWPSYGGTY
jgi:hypothetical protein